MGVVLLLLVVVEYRYITLEWGVNGLPGFNPPNSPNTFLQLVFP